MNKIMLYIGLAILLGTATMVVPLALLGPYDSIPENKDDPEVDGGTLERNYMLASPEVPVEPSAPESSDTVPEATLSKTDVASNLSSIGLMIVPSFLIALGIFVYLKKRMI